MPRNFSIGDHFERFIDEQVASGRYNSPSELVREALGLIEGREALRQIKVADLRRKVEEARSDSRPPVDGEAFLNQLEAEYAAMEAEQNARLRQSAG